jgi:membrane-associated protein
MKLMVCILTVLFGSLGLYSQDSIRLKIWNQYEAPVDHVTVSSAGIDRVYKTDPSGYATVHLNRTDSLLITAEGYEKRAIAASALKSDDIVLLKKKFTWKDLINPMFYIVYGGLWLLLFIVFAETGLFVGFFLPGDSLLFVAGIYSANLAQEFLDIFGLGHLSSEWLDLLVLCGLITLAGVLGNTVGYTFGRKIGPTMYSWRDRWLFKKKYLHQAHDFYEKHGGGAIIFARFLPIIRTFAPIVAGIVQMDRKKFAFFNVIGCVAWVVSMIFAGHFVQIWVKRQFGFELKDHLEVIVIIIIAVTTAPVLWKLFFGKRKKEKIA